MFSKHGIHGNSTEEFWEELSSSLVADMVRNNKTREQMDDIYDRDEHERKRKLEEA